ncbi:MAG TPA: CTP synthase [Candidatus Acidoferrales bacterium]|nr:CTP synthase [Candidatus Acidoferrales bacterium]
MPIDTHHLFVTGGVMSGIGKGVTTASIAKILQIRGFKVSAMKVDPYLNVDAGTMNPVAHGEVFVTDDGGEIDMDLGTYERFLDLNLSRAHNTTTGQIYTEVISKERRGDFLGQCVQIIPHITDEIKSVVRNTALKAQPDVLLIEIGGTVGDIESLPYLEAARELRLEEGPQKVFFVHVTLVPALDVVGEQKTKPTQHSVQELRRIGIQPDVIVARTKGPLLPGPRRKIGLFCNVEERAVFASPDLPTIYQAPIELDSQGMGDYISERLGFEKHHADWESWNRVVSKIANPHQLVRIALCGKYAELADSYVSVNEALKHAGGACDAKVEIDWIETELFESEPNNCSTLSRFDGILVPGGFGSRGTEGKIAALNYARERNIPTLGICFGFQMAVVEFCRHIGLKNASSTEMNPGTPYPVIDLMPEQVGVDSKGATMRLGAHEIQVFPHTLAAFLYGSDRIFERHRHRYEVNPAYIPQITKSGGVFSGKSLDGRRMEIFELPAKYFYMATQFHAEFKSRPARPSPPYYGLIKAALDKKLGKPSLDLAPLIREQVK